MLGNLKAAIPASAMLAVLLLSPSESLAQQHAHTHGRMHMDVAVDARAITVTLSSPLDTFLGFERAPRTEAEQQQLEQLLATLQSAQQLIQPDPAAQCALDSVDVESPILSDHTHDHHHADHAHDHAHDEHADMDVEVVFSCAHAHKAQFLDVQQLFRAFPRLEQVAVQVAAPQGQFKRQLHGGETRLRLVR